MLLTISTTQHPATDLGFLLHKNPARLHQFQLSAGKAYVFYPEATETRCTVALLLDIDPVALVRGRTPGHGEGGLFDQYVNDRPYVASSFMSVAIGTAFGTALTGRSKERQDLADTPLPLEACLAVVPCAEGEEFLRRLFEPLGYEVETRPEVLDPVFPEWGASPYFELTLRGTVRLKELLAHLYVLIPVLDDAKHYWVGADEVEKLLRRGEGWLESHPAKEQIAKRYLFHQRRLANEALLRLMQDEACDPDRVEEDLARTETALEGGIRLNQHRVEAILKELLAAGAAHVIDLGCGEGKLLKALLAERGFQRIAGMDVSSHALIRAQRRLQLERLPDRDRDRVAVFQGSLMYRDHRLAGFDAAVVSEVIEHLDPVRLHAFERVVFEYARPGLVVLTTPNIEYNAKFERLVAGKFRHRDHRFEWTRSEFESWASGVAKKYGYGVAFREVGEAAPNVGAPTQMAVLSREVEGSGRVED